jgi:hypothetical protein
MRKSLGGDKFLVAWCHPIELMQVDGKEEGSVVVSGALRERF